MSERQESLFIGLPRERDVVARFSVPGEPVSKARTRFTKHGSRVQAYTPEKTRAAEEAMAWHYRSAGGRMVKDPDVAFGVSATFYCATHQRRDVDNMIKAVLDGLNGVAWCDDSQVVEVAGRKRFVSEKEQAHTEVAVYRSGRVDRTEFTCRQCGKPFRMYGSWSRDKKHCSQECRSAALREMRMRTCEGCGQRFERHSQASEARFCSRDCFRRSRTLTLVCEHCGADFTRLVCHRRVRNFCSPECQSASYGPVRRTKASGTCQDCGGVTSKKSYVRCRSCNAKSRARSTTPEGM